MISTIQPDLFSVEVLPYPNQITPTMGHSGSKASEERAIVEAISGEASERQQRALFAIRGAHKQGFTWKELDGWLGWNHHGKTSSVLSVLHKAGRIVRLDETRGRCSVYVLPEFVDNRPFFDASALECGMCAKTIRASFHYCPWCGTKKGDTLAS